MYKTLSAPLMVQWEVTPNCNHNCVHCYNHWRSKKPVGIRSERSNAIYENVVKEILSNEVFAVNITGGEPLVVLRRIVPFIEQLSKNSVQVSMNSNLTLLTPENAELLKKSGLKSILVSIPSGNAETCDYITGRKNSLNRITRGISVARDAGLRIFTNMVVSRVNKDQINETAKLVASLGLNHFAATRASDPSENKDFTSEILEGEEFRQMQKTLEGVGLEFGLKTNSLEVNPPCAYGGLKPKQGYKFCNAGKTTCTIGYDGTVMPCNRVSTSYGNISEGLRDCWLRMSDWRTDVWLPKVCTKCRYKTVCGGGCKADALKAYGDITMPDPLYTTAPVPQDCKMVPEVPVAYAEEFRVNPSLKYRSEEFGSILFLTLGQWVPVTHKLASLLQGRSSVTQGEIASALSVKKDSIYATIKTLVKKRILL